MEICFIINPASGKAATKEGLEERIKSIAKSRGRHLTVLETSKAGDTQKFILDFYNSHKGEELRFYVCGGDGTLCEAVNGIMALPERENVHLGIIPVGTGNDFVRNLGEREQFLDIDAQLDAEPLQIDLLRCNDLYCINMINIGFDCQVVVKTAKIKKKKIVPSKIAYVCGLVLTLIKKPGAKLKLSHDGEGEHRELLLMTFANGGFCGGGFHSNPTSSLCDGNVDALFVNNISRRKFIGIVDRYKKGTHLAGDLDELLMSQKSHAYNLVFDDPTEISVDGEIFTVDKVDIECIPAAISVLLPRGCSYSGAREKETLTV